MKAEPLNQRFWKKVNKTKSCWLWTGSKVTNGYGCIWLNGKAKQAHRISYEIHFGSIPKNGCILHKCDTKACVNPNHLFLGTQKDNMQDRNNKNRQAFGERSGSSKLTESEIMDIRSRPIYKGSQTALAKEFKVSSRQISGIINREYWKHI